MKQFGVASGFAMVGWLSVTGAHAASADVAAGKQLALNVCASCHVVAADQPKPPRLTPPAPVFAEIADRPGTTAKTVRRFLLTTHKSLKTPPEMPSLLLTDKEASQAAAYVMSLRKRR